MTPQRCCPKCARDGRILESCNSLFVTYYRCDPCGHVWCVDSKYPDLPPRDVTISSFTIARELLLQ